MHCIQFSLEIIELPPVVSCLGHPHLGHLQLSNPIDLCCNFSFDSLITFSFVLNHSFFKGFKWHQSFLSDPIFIAIVNGS